MLFLLAACTPDPIPPLSHTAFVWQQQWGPAVEAAVQTHGPQLDGLIVLDAEIAWAEQQPRAHRVSWDLDAPVGAAIRVHPLGDVSYDVAGEVLRERVSEMIGVKPSVTEVHIDLDARSDALSDYAALLRGLRPVIGERRLSITALPDWLGRDDFGALAEAVDDYVLQVHWLAPPTSVSEPLSLMSASQTRRWVAQAGALGHPFRVALPTYGYQVGYDAQTGVALVAHAEQGRASPGLVWREVRADPAEIAPLIAEWSQERPEAMRGVCWYRLPVEGDALNWRWETLAAVKAGQVPVAALSIRADADDSGLIDVRAENTGDAGAAIASVSLSWPESVSLLAADGLGGMRWQGDQLVATTPVWLSPGEVRSLGWLRLSQPAPIEATIRRPPRP